MNIDNQELLFINENKIIKYDVDLSLLYGCLSGLLCEADKLILDIVDLFSRNDNLNRDKIIRLLQYKHNVEDSNIGIEELLKLGFLIYEKKCSDKTLFDKYKCKMNMFAPVNISLNVTHNCNLKCIYCYGDGGGYNSRGQVMSMEVAMKSIDWMLENALKMNINQCSVTFFGGEPLLNITLIEEIVNYVNNHDLLKLNPSIQVAFGLTTNGTLLDKKISKKLVDLKIYPMISIDGPPELQNHNRPFINESSSYEDVVRGFRDFYNISHTKLTARATTLTYNQLKIIKHLKDVGFSKVNISRCTGDCGSHFLTNDGTEKYINSLEELFEYDFQNMIEYFETDGKEGIIDKSFLLLISEIASRSLRPWACGAARTYCGISPDGMVYPCHRFVGNSYYKIFNIFDKNEYTDNNVIYNFVNKNINERSKCKDCWVKLICAGGCFHDNLMSTGSPYAAHENSCKIYKRTIELGLIYYYKLSKMKPNIILKICEINKKKYKMSQENSEISKSLSWT